MVNKKILIILLGLFLILSKSHASTIECACLCPAGFMVVDKSNSVDGCEKSCGAFCGGFSECEDGCEECCEEYCNNIKPEGEKLKEGCKESCESICRMREIIKNLRDTVTPPIIIMAAIMFVFFGYKFIASTSMEDRKNAKRGLIFIIVALILVGIATPLAKMLLWKKSPTTPPPNKGWFWVGADASRDCNAICSFIDASLEASAECVYESEEGPQSNLCQLCGYGDGGPILYNQNCDNVCQPIIRLSVGTTPVAYPLSNTGCCCKLTVE